MDTTILAALITVGGAALIAAVGATWRYAHEKKENRRTLALLQAECEGNRDAFSDMWDKVTSTAYWLPNTGYTFAEREFHERHRLVSLPKPIWNRQIWEGESARIRKALDATKMIQISGLYADFDSFMAVRSKLQEVFNTEIGKALATDYASWMEAKQVRVAKNRSLSGKYGQDIHAALTNFNDRTLELWNDCKVVSERIKNYRSPIPQP